MAKIWGVRVVIYPEGCAGGYSMLLRYIPESEISG
jgi:hypothetical protein